MTREELFKKNQQLSTEFELYLLEHPEIEENIPDHALIVLTPVYDEELTARNIELADANRFPQVCLWESMQRARHARGGGSNGCAGGGGDLSAGQAGASPRNREPGRAVVYVRVEKLRTSRIEGLSLWVA